MQQADKGIADARILDEFGYRIEDHAIVMVEADDHAAPHFEPVALDAMHPLEQRAGFWTDILQLLGFDQRRLIRALDSDKNAPKIGKTHQLHQLLVLGEIERGFGGERERIAPLLLPADDIA
jgi:hypothetical protein